MTLLEEQLARWPKQVAGAKAGNPFATLCYRCYGRHAPPKDDICPHGSKGAAEGKDKTE